MTTLRVERDKLDRLRAVADAHQRSVNQELRWLIDCALAEHEREAA